MMPGDPPTKQGSERRHFVTIDDVLRTAETLVDDLRTLADYKHPLEIRRGREGVRHMAADDTRSRTVKAGARTYFLDVKDTKEGTPYLVITESRFKGEGSERERSTVVVFPEDAEAFGKAVKAMLKQL